MKKKVCFVLIILASFISGYSQKVFYVAPNGNDSNFGTIDKPFQTIQKALDQATVSNVKSILLNEGVYQLDAPIVLQPRHSGIIISNFNQEKVVISGGRELNGWKKTKERLVGN